MLPVAVPVQVFFPRRLGARELPVVYFEAVAPFPIRAKPFFQGLVAVPAHLVLPPFLHFVQPANARLGSRPKDLRHSCLVQASVFFHLFFSLQSSLLVQDFFLDFGRQEVPETCAKRKLAVTFQSHRYMRQGYFYKWGPKPCFVACLLGIGGRVPGLAQAQMHKNWASRRTAALLHIAEPPCRRLWCRWRFPGAALWRFRRCGLWLGRTSGQHLPGKHPKMEAQPAKREQGQGGVLCGVGGRKNVLGRCSGLAAAFFDVYGLIPTFEGFI